MIDTHLQISKKKVSGYIIQYSLFVMLIILAGIFVFNYTWSNYETERRTEAIRLSASIEAFLMPEEIQALEANETDLEKPYYLTVKQSLADFKAHNSLVHFAYVLRMTQDKVYFLVDSEPADSAGYSPPGQEYYEATEAYKAVFKTGEIHVTAPITDRWGTWITVLIPILKANGTEVAGVLGVDYDASQWYGAIRERVSLAVILHLCVYIILFVALRLHQKNRHLKRTEAKLVQSEAAFRAVFDQASIGISVVTEHEHIQQVNPEFSRIIGRTVEELQAINWRQMTHPEDIEQDERQFRAFMAGEIDGYAMEKRYLAANGKEIWVLMQISKYNLEDGDDRDYLCIIVDISELKARETEIRYLSEHDYLTNLHNRRYLETAMQAMDVPENLPLSIIQADINGLRLINDAFGHREGDLYIMHAAEMVRKCCRQTDVISRSGGEFQILMPHTSVEEVSERVQQMIEEIERYNLSQNQPTSQFNISFGHSTKVSSDKQMKDTLIEAEKMMNKQKLMERKSYRSSLITSIMGTLYARSEETEEHSQRLLGYCKAIGKKLKLPKKNLDELELLSMLHDIGKIGIDDRILNKPGALTEDEWVEMKKHPEIGYRIAMYAPELETIAIYILTHHERWDGKGYPQGLRGTDIPLVSRILCVADAYDAMTENRVYRKALTPKEAIEELRRNAGSQFDAAVVKAFVEVLASEELPQNE